MLRSACLLALALASGSAQALGLGQIQVKSGIGEPLLAEIPVISNDPSELVGLDAGLASPETFTRIGLEPPIGIVADLQFTVGSDTQGRPVIRITTAQPVTQPLLNFLVEVDWGQGRLVREYTATVDQPGSIAAQPAAPVEAPVVDAPAVVERPVAAAQPPVPASVPQQATPAAATPTAATPATPQSPDSYRVRAGDTASRIAARVAPAGVNAEQTMVGLLRANPEAFIGGDLNQLRQGSVLRVPAAGELEAVEAREAAEIVRSFTRQVRRPRSQPDAPVAQATAPTHTAAVPEASGRLEIVPPGAGRKARGGTQSGIEAGGEGEMLRQELAQTKESLAARDAEVQELKSRLADLEKLQHDQQKLIAMQNSQLSAAQQRQAAVPPPPPAPQGTSPLPWIAGGALVLLGLFAAAWNRRRSRREPVFVAPAPSRPSLADAFATPAPQPVEPVAEAPVDAVPSWQRGATASRMSAPAAHVPMTEPASDDAVASSALGTVPVDAANVERLELAQAYVDLGDTENARRLLAEVADTGDATARGVATKMLRDLG